MPSFLRRLRDLFAAGPAPRRRIEDVVLGPLDWNEEEEGWVGTLAGLRFELTYNRNEAPSEALLAYARDLLGSPEWLREQLEAAKEVAVAEYDAFYAAEIQGLGYEVVSFYEHKERLRVIATIGPGRDYRLWRIEFAGRTCEGIGFDS